MKDQNKSKYQEPLIKSDKISPQMQKTYDNICAGKKTDGNKVVGSIYE